MELSLHFTPFPLLPNKPMGKLESPRDHIPTPSPKEPKSRSSVLNPHKFKNMPNS